MGFEGSRQFKPEEASKAQVPKQEVESKQEEILTPEVAIQKLSSEMDEIEASGELPSEKGVFIERMTDLLRAVATTEDPQSYKFFRSDTHFQKLKIRSRDVIQNSFDRDLHERIITYLDDIGIQTTDEERLNIKKFFEARDNEKRKSTLESYAQNGLLTLKTAVEKGVLKETSATPGDFSSAELEELSADEFNNLRGYELTPDDVSDSLFYGRNSFFQVVMERGGEEIDKASKISKLEVENRLRNSMVFVVRTDKVEISRRAEGDIKEDIVGRDVKPDEIDYLIVDPANLALAQEAYGHLPVKIVEAEYVEADIEGMYGGPYKLPNYKGKIEEIAKSEGAIWSHIARLPVDTYPE